MKSGNPFTLTFGKQPDTLIMRYEVIDRIVTTFTRTDLNQTYLIEGVRGSGKTVLMTTVANILRSEHDWLVVNINPTLDLLDDLARRLNDVCRTIPNLLSKGFNVSIAGFGVGVGSDNKLRDSISVITDILDILKKKNKKLLITIDEVANDKNMKMFASQFQIFLREDYPVYLIMTGLYENITKIQNDPALTFLLRSPKVKTDPLSIMQITRRYSELFDIDEDKAMELAYLTKGYAFAFQALGAVYWENRNKGIEEVIKLYDEMLDGYVYQKIWSTLTQREREIIRAIGEDNTKISEVVEKTGIKSGTLSQYRETLIQKGLITSPAHGYVSLALPHFAEVTRVYRL